MRPLAPETPGRAGTRRRPRWLPSLLAAAALVLAAGAGTAVWEQTRSDAPTASVADRVLDAADAQRFDVELAGGARASVVRSVSQGRAVLITHDMPPAPSGRVYELWLQTPAGTMEPAGLMDGAGSTTVVLKGDAATATGVGITVEPEGGSEAPSSDPVALFDFRQST